MAAMNSSVLAYNYAVSAAGKRAAMPSLAAVAFTAVSSNFAANAGVIDDYLEKSKANKPLHLKNIPGDFGLPFVGPISDRLDYFDNQGKDEFFWAPFDHNTLLRTCSLLQGSPSFSAPPPCDGTNIYIGAHKDDWIITLAQFAGDHEDVDTEKVLKGQIKVQGRTVRREMVRAMSRKEPSKKIDGRVSVT
ncbi:hypothetical protein ACFX1Q_008316 [Malus domestica]